MLLKVVFEHCGLFGSALGVQPGVPSCKSILSRTRASTRLRPVLPRRSKLQPRFTTNSFPGNYTVNIRYGWGTWDNQVDPGLRNANGAEGGPVTGTTVSYATVKSWLTADAQLPVQQEALASLPASNSAFPNDANTFYVSSAEEKAFGVYTGSSSAVDGAIGFGTGPVQYIFWRQLCMRLATPLVGPLTTTQVIRPLWTFFAIRGGHI